MGRRNHHVGLVERLEERLNLAVVTNLFDYDRPFNPQNIDLTPSPARSAMSCKRRWIITT
jgi:hypothetical protein